MLITFFASYLWAKHNSMITFPNAKINIGLYITEKRPDGFHNIETIFLPIPKLCDILEVLPKTSGRNSIEFSQTGLAVDADISQNLCVKAYYLLSSHTALPNVLMHLHKQIPMGAGLGGGSADGAFALRMLNTLADNPVEDEKLLDIALELGSDCPFFLINKPCFGQGRGEVLSPVNLPLNGCFIAIVNPGIHVNTGFAYKNSQPKPAPINLKQLDRLVISSWRDSVSNDFDKVVFPHHPEIERVKEKLYQLGAVYSSMSGSGSTIFGIFADAPDLKGEFQNYFTHISRI